MPVPVPTDIMVRPRVPEAPLRLLPPRGLLNASAALLRSFNGDKMTLDAHADQFFASAEEGAFGLELKRYDYLKSHRLAGRGGWGQKYGTRTTSFFAGRFCTARCATKSSWTRSWMGCLRFTKVRPRAFPNPDTLFTTPGRVHY